SENRREATIRFIGLIGFIPCGLQPQGFILRITLHRSNITFLHGFTIVEKRTFRGDAPILKI
ncbi:MAG TPA: hypothetical protein DD467_06320, partial [Alistipes sp.]|nr:hypothetical protein [Alistipes sp.]